jgi:hypothetical protein
MSVDRLKAAGRAVVGLDPMIRYRCLYRCKVVGQSGDTVDVRPYDSALPDMARIPLRHGVPGLKIQVTPGCSVQVGFDDGRPDRPFAALWSTDATAVRVCLAGTSVELGAWGAVEPLILGASRVAVETTELQNLVQQFESLALTCDKAGLPLSAGFRLVKDTLQAFLDALPATLSLTVKTT